MLSTNEVHFIAAAVIVMINVGGFLLLLSSDWKRHLCRKCYEPIKSGNTKPLPANPKEGQMVFTKDQVWVYASGLWHRVTITDEEV